MKGKFIKDAKESLLLEIPPEADRLEVWALTKDACWAPFLEIDLKDLFKGYFFPFIIKFRFTGQRSQLNLTERGPACSETGQ